MFIISSAVLNIILTFLISVKSINDHLQQLLFGVLRLLSGIACNFYAVAVVIAIEICGPSKRVMASNIIYYFYVLGEFLVVFFAYFVTDFRVYYGILTGIITLIAFYFWFLPESPRWLLANNRSSQAYLVFKRIAKSNKKDFENLNELECLKKESTNNRVGPNINLCDTANLEPLKETKKVNAVS
jgi:MFS family permease